jgi:hypothetical protein
MKKITLYTLAILLFGTLCLSSCKKTEDTAPSTSTANNGFPGNWHNSENSSINGPATYPITVTDSTALIILFSYLYGFHTKINATIINNNFTIPSQVIEGNSVSGSGVLANSTRINMIYVVNNGLNKDTVTAVLTR